MHGAMAVSEDQVALLAAFNLMNRNIILDNIGEAFRADGEKLRNSKRRELDFEKGSRRCLP
jgi:hypothetical protein